jgi:hypothetical protein
MEWMLKREHDLVLAPDVFPQHGPWVLQDMNYKFFRDRIDPYLYEEEEAISDEEEFQWSSDDEEDRGVIVNGDMAKQCYRGDITILGFHPFKEIIFLLLCDLRKTVAYNYNSFKAEVLGSARATYYDRYYNSVPNQSYTIEGLPYVPCWLEEFPTSTKSGRSP